MRFDGILRSWNDAAGSGIIKPGKGGDEIVVHSAAFPRDGRLPAPGEAVSFAIEIGPDGIKRACNIARLPTAERAPRTAARHARARSFSMFITAALVVLAATSAVVYATMRHAGEAEALAPSVALTEAAIEEAAPRRPDPVAATRFTRPPAYSCDGRTRCSQMTSCEEAKFFVRNCPGTAMDGDGDGIPCERQCQPGL